MNMARAKSILIILFVILNIFLLATFYTLKTDSENAKIKSIENVKQILIKNNISVNIKDLLKIPNEIPVYELSNLCANPEELFLKLTGKQPVKSQTGAFTLEDKTLKLVENGFQFDDPTTKVNSYKNIDKINATTKIKDDLSKKLGIKSDYFDATSVNVNDGNYSVNFILKINNLNVFNSQFSVTANQDGIRKIRGILFSPKQVNDQKMQLVRIENILIGLIQNPDIKKDGSDVVTLASYGYYIPINDNAKTLRVIPSYKITINIDKNLYFDARLDVPAEKRYLGNKTT